MGGEVDYKDFYKFMHDKDMLKKFTIFCCICQKSEKNEYYTTYKNGGKKLYQNYKYDYIFDMCIKRESYFKYGLQNYDKLEEFLYKDQDKCYHFYHDGCFNKKIGCVFCKMGYSLQNAHMFCKMRESDFTEVIKKYKSLKKIDYIKKYFYLYRFKLLESAYSFIYNNEGIDKSLKDKYMDKQNFERDLRRKSLIKYGSHEPTEEIAFSEIENWKSKYDKILIKEREQLDARRKKELEEEEDNDDNDDQEEYEERENNYKSLDTTKHEVLENVRFCNDCRKGKCVICGRRGPQEHAVRAHGSCHKKYRQKFLCGKCNKKCKSSDHFYGYCCLNCWSKYDRKCYFCQIK